jgi:hypothetical protein
VRVAVVVLALAALASVAARASAQPPLPGAHMPTRVVLRRSACAAPSLDEASFARLLGIELAADGVTEVATAAADDAVPAGGPPLAVLSLDGACEGGALITFEIDDAATSKKLRRVIDLRDLPARARARALALATAELLRASWAELVFPDAPPPRAAVPAAIREAAAVRLAGAPLVHAAQPPAPVRAPTFVTASVEGRHFFSPGVSLVGGRLSASLPLASVLRLHLDAGVARGTSTDALGRIDLWLVTAAAGPSFGLSWSSAAVEIGPRLELGWGFTRGLPANASVTGHSGSALLVMTSLAATGRLRLGSRWWSTLDIEGGPVLKGFTARADARDASGLGGAMGVARLGVAVSL